jgi:hypothetical protein
MMRLIGFIVAAAAILLVLWLLLWGVIHTLLIAFWVVIVAVLGLGLFRVGRWTSRKVR